MNDRKRKLEDYAPKVMTLEQYMFLYTYDIEGIGDISKEEAEERELNFRESIKQNHVDKMTHDDFKIWIQMIKERVVREMQDNNMTFEFLDALKKLKRVYAEILVGKENSNRYQREYEKLKNKIILGDKYRNLIVRLDNMKIFKRDDLIKDMLFYGDVVLVKDVTGKEKFYQNPYCNDLDDKYYTNALGENIFDTVVSFSDFQVLEEKTKKKER